MSKQIQYAGYSIVKDGTWKFRTATDEKRIAQLEAFGESVYMVSIRPVNTKGAAAKELLAMDYMGKDPACVAFFVKHVKDARSPWAPLQAPRVLGSLKGPSRPVNDPTVKVPREHFKAHQGLSRPLGSFRGL